jgi:hypothetical protein
MLSSKEEYDELLKSGMFFEFYPQLSGNYDTDFDEWKEIYDKLKTATDED